MMTSSPDVGVSRLSRSRCPTTIGDQVMLAAGTSAEVMGGPPPYEFLVAVDAEDRKDKPTPMVRMDRTY